MQAAAAEAAAAAAELAAALESPWLGESPEVARSALAPHRYGLDGTGWRNAALESTAGRVCLSNTWGPPFSAPRYPYCRRVRPDHYKGMTAAQRAEILDEQAAQVQACREAEAAEAEAARAEAAAQAAVAAALAQRAAQVGSRARAAAALALQAASRAPYTPLRSTQNCAAPNVPQAEAARAAAAARLQLVLEAQAAEKRCRNGAVAAGDAALAPTEAYFAQWGASHR